MQQNGMEAISLEAHAVSQLLLPLGLVFLNQNHEVQLAEWHVANKTASCDDRLHDLNSKPKYEFMCLNAAGYLKRGNGVTCGCSSANK